MHTHAAVGHQGAGRETNTVVAMMEGQVVKLASIRKCDLSHKLVVVGAWPLQLATGWLLQAFFSSIYTSVCLLL